MVESARVAVRSLARARVFTGACVVCTAVGIAGAATAWSALDTAVLRPVRLPEVDRLVTVYRTTERADSAPLSAPMYLRLARRSATIDTFAATAVGGGLLETPSGTISVVGRRVTGSMLALLGAKPLIGRLLSDTDDQRAADPAVVISDDVWHAQFRSSAAVIGSTVAMSGVAYRVVGVVPASFGIPHGRQLLRADVWLPMRFTEAELARPLQGFLMVKARLASHATLRSARSELETALAALTREHRELRNQGVRIVSLVDDARRYMRTSVAMVFVVAVLLLAGATANVLSMFVARAMARAHEVSIRSALGASFAGAMNGIWAEVVLVALIGATGAMACVLGLVHVLVSLASGGFPFLSALTVDGSVVTFAGIATLAVATCAIAATSIAARRDGCALLRSHRSVQPSLRYPMSLVVGIQVALTVVMLVLAGLSVRHVQQVAREDPGFDVSGVYTQKVRLASNWYKDPDEPKKIVDTIVRRVRADSSVEAAGVISAVPYDDWGSNMFVSYDGKPAGDSRLVAEVRIVTPGIFQVTRQRVLHGRLFEDDEPRGDVKSVVVNEALMAQHFNGSNPVGRRLDASAGWSSRIVAVVTNVSNAGPGERPKPGVYVSLSESDIPMASFPLMIRLRPGRGASALAVVGAAASSAEPRAATSEARSLRRVIADSTERERFYVVVLSTLAGVSCIVAACGIYGVIGYYTVQRRRELAIRAVLGCSPLGLMRVVATDIALASSAGLSIGLLASAGLARAGGQMLGEVGSSDLRVWGVATVAVLALSGLASATALARQWRVDLSEATRAD